MKGGTITTRADRQTEVVLRDYEHELAERLAALLAAEFRRRLEQQLFKE